MYVGLDRAAAARVLYARTATGTRGGPGAGFGMSAADAGEGLAAALPQALPVSSHSLSAQHSFNAPEPAGLPVVQVSFSGLSSPAMP